MPAILPFQNPCCTTCEDAVTANLPGATGDSGAGATDGEDGKNAFTTTTASFTQPAVGGTVVVNVLDSSWAAIGQHVFVTTGGHYTVTAKTATTKLTLQNLGYDDNAAVAATIAAGKQVSPDGHAGADGLISGAAGGDLKGNYPGPQIALANSKGSVIIGDGTDCQSLNVGGTNGHRLRVNSAAVYGQDYAPVNLENAGGFTEVAGKLPITSGGTGQITAPLAFNALSPTTLRGDIIARNAGGSNVRLGVGTAGRVLKSDGMDPNWSTIGISSLDATVGLATLKVYVAKHMLAAGSDGGSSVSGAWTARSLNREAVNTIGGVAAIAANQVTLPAGTYRVHAWSTLYSSDQHRCGLWNATAADWLTDTHSGDDLIGTPADAASASTMQATAAVCGRFTIESDSAIELRYRCETSKATNGLGFPLSWGVKETYAMVLFEQEAIASEPVVPPTEEGEQIQTEDFIDLVTEAADGSDEIVTEEEL